MRRMSMTFTIELFPWDWKRLSITRFIGEVYYHIGPFTLGVIRGT